MIAEVPFKASGSFNAMGLAKELVSGLNRMGYSAPTPVQRKALPIALAGMDVVCMARTGSGKTCVFLLPMIHKVKAHDSIAGVRAVILSPTRELAVQTFRFAKDMAKFTDIRIISIVGGDPIEAQFEALASRPDIIIATPGRLMHHIREIPTFTLKACKYLVFDEADRLFEMGFAEQLNEIVRECPEERQTLLFSATMPKQLIQFSRAGLRDPQLIRLETDAKMSDELRMANFVVRSNEKYSALLYLVRRIIPSDQMTIVFTATRHHSEFVHSLFNHIGVTSTLVYGTMDQDARSTNLKAFRQGTVSYLIVTDLAARGIDVPLLNNVINLHFPPSPKLFVHRCGRAARQGRIGFALSLVEPEEMAFLVDVHTFLNKEVTVVEQTTEQSQRSYTLENMQPSFIHTGTLPQDVLDEENDFLKRALADDDNLQTLARIGDNGMKQYRRTRSEASREGVSTAKKLSKANSVRSIHPLIAGMDPKRCTQQIVDKANFVKMLQTFRPAQTVFESGIGLGTGSQVIKGKRKKGSAESHGVEVMRQLRRIAAPSLERNKVKLLPVTADGLAEPAEGDVFSSSWDALGAGDDGGGDDEYYDETVPSDSVAGGKRRARDEDGLAEGDQEVPGIMPDKPRLSIAEKKRLKKQGMSNAAISETAHRRAATNELIANSTTDSTGSGRGQKRSRTGLSLTDSIAAGAAMGGFKDPKFYMPYGTEDEAKNFSESSMQPMSGLKTVEAQNAAYLESAMLDVAPDDAVDMNKKKRVMRWDAKKRKFVKVGFIIVLASIFGLAENFRPFAMTLLTCSPFSTLHLHNTLNSLSSQQSLEEIAQLKGPKRARSESGGGSMQTSKIPQGEMYAKWKKKSKREVSAPGQGDAEDDRPVPNVRVNRHAPVELKTADVIRKAKAVKADKKLKNMSKDRRGKIEGQKRKKRAFDNAAAMRKKTKAGGRKVKAILRM